MTFSSTIFLFFFLPITVIGYYLIRSELKNLFLLVASLLFYAWGEPRLVCLLTTSILVNYLLALRIEPRRERASGKAYVAVMLLWNFGVLFYYKYLAFAVTNVNAAFGTSISIPDIALPLGISFFTFRAVSYCLDVYWGTSAAQLNPINTALYISFFPQVTMGPIARYGEFEAQLKDRKVSIDSLSDGVKRIVVGLAKKVILADQLGIMVDAVFSTPGTGRTTMAAWMAAIAYTLQIYYDFSGYSDMAIGIGQLFGFHFSENFDKPYTSKSLSEFWRRWHISLGSWFRDYVYIPLGGSRVKSQSRRIWNLFVVWVLTGLWHGAAWNFLAWGLLNFAVIAFEKVAKIPQKLKRPLGRYAYQAFTMLTVMFGWVFFRAAGLKNGLVYLACMFGFMGNAVCTEADLYIIQSNWVILVIGVICCIPLPARLKQNSLIDSRSFVIDMLNPLWYAVLYIVGIAFAIGGTYQAFIYFNF